MHCGIVTFCLPCVKQDGTIVRHERTDAHLAERSRSLPDDLVAVDHLDQEAKRVRSLLDGGRDNRVAVLDASRALGPEDLTRLDVAKRALLSDCGRSPLDRATSRRKRLVEPLQPTPRQPARPFTVSGFC